MKLVKLREERHKVDGLLPFEAATLIAAGMECFNYFLHEFGTKIRSNNFVYSCDEPCMENQERILKSGPFANEAEK